MDIPAASVFIESQHLLACWRRDVRCHCRPGLPASCGRNVDSPAEIGSRRTRQMKCAGYRSWRCHPEADGVHSRGSHVDGITEPLPGTRPAQIEAASCVGRCFQINTIGAIAVPCTVDGVHIVGNSLTTYIVILCLHGAWDRCWRSTERPFGCRTSSSKHLYVIQVGTSIAWIVLQLDGRAWRDIDVERNC